MRQLIVVTTATSIALGFALLGQTSRRHATTHTLAHSATACAASLEACSPEGCGGGDPSLNKKKNRIDVPSGDPQEFTFEDFVHLETERPGPGGYTPGDRAEIEGLGEDTYVALAGYLIGAHPGSPETCNCNFPVKRTTIFTSTWLNGKQIASLTL